MVIELMDWAKDVIVLPSIALSHVVTGKNMIALATSTRIGKSISNGFARDTSESGTLPETAPYFSSLYNLPVSARSSDAFIGPKSREKTATQQTMSSVVMAYRLYGMALIKNVNSLMPSLSKPCASRTMDMTVTTQLEIGARMQ